MSAPVDPASWWGLSFFEWAITTALGVMATVGGVMAKIYLGLQKRITLLEKDFAQTTHDINGIRAMNISIERNVAERHVESQRDRDDLRDFLTEEMRYLRTKIDQLVERRNPR